MDFSRKDFESTLDRRPTWSIKWDPDYMDERFNNHDLIPFNHAEMDFICPQPIIESIKERSQHGIYGYTLVKSDYYDSIINWYKKRYNILYNREEILYSTGVIFSLRIIVQFFTKPGDNILIFPPIYQPLSDAITDQQRKRVMVPLFLHNNHYTMDLTQIEREIEKQKIKMCVICNPHNPVGRVWTEKELKRLMELCASHDIIVVSDEIHRDIISKSKKFATITHISDKIGGKAIAISSFTKTFNTSGLKIANIFIRNHEIRQPFFKFFEKKFIYAPNVFGILALQAAYNKCSAWVDILQDYLDQNYNYVKTFINNNDLDINLIHREGTPVIWLDFRHYSISSKKLFTYLVKEARVIPYAGSDFTANGEGFQRLSIGYPRNILKEGLNRIKEALNKI